MTDLADPDVGAQFASMIESAVISTGKFKVFERKSQGKLVKEQNRAKSGLVTTNTPGRIGGFEGVDYLIYGTLQRVSVNHKENVGKSILGTLFSPEGAPPVTCSNTFVTLEAELRITDLNTGEIAYNKKIKDTRKSAASCGGAAPVDVNALLSGAAEKVATGLVTRLYPIQVAQVQSDGVFVLNYGEGAVLDGAIMTVFEKGEPIRDPATGKILANNEIQLGMIQVTDVLGPISKARPISAFSGPVGIGAIVRPASDDEIAAWKAANKKNKKKR